MDLLGKFHPAIVHMPIAWLLASALFEVIGRLVDIDWWRRASFVLLVFGVLFAGVAILSGRAAEDPAEERQGVPEHAIEQHERLAYITLALGALAVVARVASRALPMRSAVSGLALLLQLAAAVVVGFTGFRGGALVFDHAAGVRVHGELVRSGPTESGEHEAAPK